MGIRVGATTDLATNVRAASFTGTGNGGVFYPKTDFRASNGGYFNAVLSGTFVGTVLLERSFDGGTTYLPVYDDAGTAVSYTAPAARRLREPEPGVAYRWRCSAYTSGTAVTRLSQ